MKPIVSRIFYLPLFLFVFYANQSLSSNPRPTVGVASIKVDDLIALSHAMGKEVKKEETCVSEEKNSPESGETLYLLDEKCDFTNYVVYSISTLCQNLDKASLTHIYTNGIVQAQFTQGPKACELIGGNERQPKKDNRLYQIQFYAGRNPRLTKQYQCLPYDIQIETDADYFYIRSDAMELEMAKIALQQSESCSLSSWIRPHAAQ
ncbi:hypothetical protein M9194_14850 [Vibrio sp. S4M6]|nr:hypothetical protein [Vibrio sinus]MCL9782712.1 hypothetical protein [Vibrio sinus]